ncbi:hypothetical protein BDQ12DRAFT_665820 [Crucibulum laeve]|uniref:HAT C-terminal dimerisation domain-containing protein n=1 Tax=Crucibulum laeve TaxID=68775 RepID=A0A5C3M0W6_9AGAR|nr:hypothetical protein BDQ12DRAFT_665820 [Crucibulum laeve]
MPTVWHIIPALEFLMKRWETMTEQPQYCDIKDAITAGIKSLKKWYWKVDHTSDAYFICLVLDPNVKDLYCHHCWELSQYEAGMRQLEEFDKYYVSPLAVTDSAAENTVSYYYNVIRSIRNSPLWSSFLLDSVQMFQQAEKAAGSATPSEQAFSSGGITDAAWRNQLSTDVFLALQILKSAYRNGHISAVHQAGEHVNALIVALDGQGFNFDEEY